MSFSVPSLSTLKTRTLSDITGRVSGLSAILKNSLVNALATAMGGLAYGLYKYIGWASKQAFPDTAEMEYLERWGAIKGISRIAATYASGLVDVTGTTGSYIPAGAVLVSTSGLRYSVDEAITLSSTTGNVSVTAEVAGSDYSLAEGSELTFETSYAGIDSTAIVSTNSELSTTGTAAETDTSYRTRVVSAFAYSPRGGADYDYKNWAAAACSALTRSWVFAKKNDSTKTVGDVALYFMCDTDAGQIVPTESQIASVQTYITYRMMCGTTFTAAAPATEALNITVAIYPNTSAIQTACRTEVANMLLEKAAPNGTLYLSDITAAFNRVSSLQRFSVSSPSSDTTYTSYTLPIPGTITFSTMS